MKEQLKELAVCLIWISIVFLVSDYFHVPRRTAESLIKTLPTSLLGVWLIEVGFRKRRKKKKKIL